jgi:hypothetical protein
MRDQNEPEATVLLSYQQRVCQLYDLLDLVYRSNFKGGDAARILDAMDFLKAEIQTAEAAQNKLETEIATCHIRHTHSNE